MNMTAYQIGREARLRARIAGLGRQGRLHVARWAVMNYMLGASSEEAIQLAEAWARRLVEKHGATPQPIPNYRRCNSVISINAQRRRAA